MRDRDDGCLSSSTVIDYSMVNGISIAENNNATNFKLTIHMSV
jgi:hypothetical protein